MAGTVEQGGQHAQSSRGRSVLFALNPGQGEFLLALEVILGERCVEDYVGKQIERRVELRFQRRERYKRRIEIRRGAQLRTQQLTFIVDLKRGAGFRAVGEQAHREVRRTR